MWRSLAAVACLPTAWAGPIGSFSADIGSYSFTAGLRAHASGDGVRTGMIRATTSARPRSTRLDAKLELSTSFTEVAGSTIRPKPPGPAHLISIPLSATAFSAASAWLWKRSDLASVP